MSRITWLPEAPDGCRYGRLAGEWVVDCPVCRQTTPVQEHIDLTLFDRWLAGELWVRP